MAFLGVHVYKWVARGDGVDALEVRKLLTHVAPVHLPVFAEAPHPVFAEAPHDGQRREYRRRAGQEVGDQYFQSLIINSLREVAADSSREVPREQGSEGKFPYWKN